MPLQIADIIRQLLKCLLSIMLYSLASANTIVNSRMMVMPNISLALTEKALSNIKNALSGGLVTILHISPDLIQPDLSFKKKCGTISIMQVRTNADRRQRIIVSIYLLNFLYVFWNPFFCS